MTDALGLVCGASNVARWTGGGLYIGVAGVE